MWYNVIILSIKPYLHCWLKLCLDMVCPCWIQLIFYLFHLKKIKNKNPALPAPVLFLSFHLEQNSLNKFVCTHCASFSPLSDLLCWSHSLRWPVTAHCKLDDQSHLIFQYISQQLAFPPEPLSSFSFQGTAHACCWSCLSSHPVLISCFIRLISLTSKYWRAPGLSPWLSPWKWNPLSRVWLFVTPWTIQSMDFSRLEYWSG